MCPSADQRLSLNGMLTSLVVTFMMSCMWCELQTCHTWLGHVESWRWVCWACGYCFKFSSSISVNILFYRIGFYCESTMLIKTKQKSLQFSCSVVSDSLWPHELQHARPPCLSPTPGVYPNSCPSSPWCHPAISSSVVPFSSCPQSLPASGSFPMSQLFTWGGQSTGVSASASVLPKNTQDWSPLEWTGWISLQSKGLSRVFSIMPSNSIHVVANDNFSFFVAE